LNFNKRGRITWQTRRHREIRPDSLIIFLLFKIVLWTGSLDLPKHKAPLQNAYGAFFIEKKVKMF